MTAQENLRAALEKVYVARQQLHAITYLLLEEQQEGHAPNRMRATVARVSDTARAVHQSMEFLNAYIHALYKVQDNAATAERDTSRIAVVPESKASRD